MRAWDAQKFPVNRKIKLVLGTMEFGRQGVDESLVRMLGIPGALTINY